MSWRNLYQTQFRNLSRVSDKEFDEIYRFLLEEFRPTPSQDFDSEIERAIKWLSAQYRTGKRKEPLKVVPSDIVSAIIAVRREKNMHTCGCDQCKGSGWVVVRPVTNHPDGTNYSEVAIPCTCAKGNVVAGRDVFPDDYDAWRRESIDHEMKLREEEKEKTKQWLKEKKELRESVNSVIGKLTQKYAEHEPRAVASRAPCSCSAMGDA